MAGRLPPTDASEAHVTGMTKEGYLASRTPQAITDEAWLAPNPKQPAWMKSVYFIEEPEQTKADRMASILAKLKSQGLLVSPPTETEAPDARNYPDLPAVESREETPAEKTLRWQQIIDKEDEEDAQPTEAMVAEFTRQCGPK